MAGTKAAENLARGDRIPSPIVGPQYEIDEAGLQYVGFVLVSAIPVWNNGSPLQRQREAEHCRAHQALQQARQRVVAQVRSGAVRWNGAVGLVNQTRGLSTGLARVAADLEDLFQQGQADLTRLLQAQQRVIQLKNTETATAASGRPASARQTCCWPSRTSPTSDTMTSQAALKHLGRRSRTCTFTFTSVSRTTLSHYLGGPRPLRRTRRPHPPAELGSMANEARTTTSQRTARHS